MAKPLHRPPVSCDPSAESSSRHWIAAILLVLAAAYFVVFLLSDVRRLYALSLALIPDALVSEWMGGDVARVGLLDRLPLLAIAATILVVAAATGRLLLEAVSADRGLTRLEQFVFALGVGLNVWSLYALAVGLLGQLQNRFVLFAPVIVIGPLAVWRCRAWWKTDSTPARRGSPDPAAPARRGSPDPAETSDLRSPPPTGSVWPRWMPRAWLACCLPFVLLVVLEGMIPPWHFDTREYHLQVPKEWFRAGRVEFLPHNVYGNMPLGAEMHAVLAMGFLPGEDAWWWGALAGKTVIASFAIWTMLGVYAAGRRFVSRTAASLSAFAFISTPWVVHVSVSGLIDCVSAFYYLLAGYAALLWRESVDKLDATRDAASSEDEETATDARRTARGRLLLAGFCAGSAVACKYPALLFLVFPLLAYVTLVPRGVWRWRAGLVFLLAVVCACGLWFGKNVALTGNPTYPLLYEVFGGETRTEAKADQWTRAHRTPRNAGSFSLGQVRNSVMQLTLESDYLSPLLWPLALIALASWRERPLVRVIVALMAIVVFFWWTLTHRVDRFLLPLLPPMCLIVGIGGTWSSTKLWRTGLFTLTMAALLLNGLIAASRVTSDNRFLVALSDLRRDVEHPRDAGWSRVHPALTWLNEHVPPSYQVLLVGEAQVFDLAVPALYNTCFDDCVFEQLLRDRTAAERRALLRDQRISHVLVNWHELDRYREPGNYGYSDYATRTVIRDELVRQQGILRPIDIGLDPENSQLFEVVGWRDWDTTSE